MDDPYEGYAKDVAIAWAFRCIFLVTMVAFVAVICAGCTRLNAPSQKEDQVVKGELPPLDLLDSTRNDQPQGGDHEKSDRAPIKPCG